MVYDDKEDVIPKSIQLVAGRTGREYNQRKNRKGAFWEDRYHATAVETGHHLIRCLVYIDLNMVRAGAVEHSSDWSYGGYNEIQNPKQRYTFIDRNKLTELLELNNEEQLKASHYKWVEAILKSRSNIRDSKWSESIAVGKRSFVDATQTKLGSKAIGRKKIERDGIYELRESQMPYSNLFEPENSNLSQNNNYFWSGFN